MFDPWYLIEIVTEWRCWPLWFRRLFVLTLPISFPLWGVAILLAFVHLMLTALVAFPFLFIVSMWSPK